MGVRMGMIIASGNQTCYLMPGAWVELGDFLLRGFVERTAHIKFAIVALFAAIPPVVMIFVRLFRWYRSQHNTREKDIELGPVLRTTSPSPQRPSQNLPRDTMSIFIVFKDCGEKHLIKSQQDPSYEEPRIPFRSRFTSTQSHPQTPNPGSLFAVDSPAPNLIPKLQAQERTMTSQHRQHH
ncbi:hypothetical protein F5B21DRAFT_482823 [Xylaria acuta]|nr:hypothetical protein F5B21DRAFT_482823 [Xylaria acuta]